MLALGLALTPPRAPARWWPNGATFAADFAARRYMRNGVEITEAAAISVARSGAAWSTTSTGALLAHGANEPRFVPGGLLLEPERTRISQAPVNLAGAAWTNTSPTTSSALAAEGLFAAPVRIISAGQDYHRRISASMELIAGEPVQIKVRYKAGTSPSFGIYMRSNAANLQSILYGPVGAEASQSVSAGTWTDILTTQFAGSYELETTFTPNQSQADWNLGLSPRTSAAGEYVDVFGAQIVSGSSKSSWILGDPSIAISRASESLIVPDVAFPSTAILTFSDATQQVADATSSTLNIAAAVLSRRIIQSIVIQS